MTTKLEELKARQAEEMAKLEREMAIAELLPDNVSPTISNIADDGAWLSFHAPSYNPEKTWNPVAILESLEIAGFEQCPSSLVRWDNYRRTPEAGLCDDIPDTKNGGFGGNYKLTDVEAIAPVWVVPCQHTGCDVQLFMRKAGQLFRVSVDIPRVAHLAARKIESRGDWRFDRQSARLLFPDQWHSLEHCTVSARSYCQADTDKGLNGAIYFTPHDEQANWPMKASEFVRDLLTN